MLTFQGLIHKLNLFWERHGCVIHQGYDLEMGAGTFNPVTFLRCLGPEPYRAAYVEPSRRPGDGRYGENPNRMHLFHQYQVIVKPSLPNIQELYLKSLGAIGLNLKEHDVRFVHDDWESPTLGAWGLGWEVWIDGMEASQFTYFQAIGGLPVKPITAEITYGLERLAMYIQNVDSMFDIKWNGSLTLRDIIHRSEVEWSTYNFEEASTEMWQRHFADYEQEARALIARQLPLPAYDFVVKASHAFNLLDSRGAISVTERTGYIARIRDLARLIAIEYLASRERLGFPLHHLQSPPPARALPKPSRRFQEGTRGDFVLEIGSEQLPATFVPIGCRHLERDLRSLLEARGLSYGRLEVYGTPRRLAVRVFDLEAGTPNKSVERRGPALSAAFDAHGNPTPQGTGFFKSLGLPARPLNALPCGGVAVHRLKHQDYLVAHVKQPGASAISLLAEALPALILGLDFPKKMRWGEGDIAFPRPLHWIVALFDERVIPFQVGDISSGRYTYGHAQLAPRKIRLDHAASYLSSLRQEYVMADPAERRDAILKQLAALERELEGSVLEKERVLNQVLYLAEYPQLTSASFDARFLAAPPEVLISEMVEHQKYFPVADSAGALRPFFLITADNTPNDLIRRGNQKVLSARLADGVFLYEQDLSTPLETFNAKLAHMTFQKDLGSVLDKAMRLTAHVAIINRSLQIADDSKCARAALLCKADLASALVGEFPELQGTAGKYFAIGQHEDKEVAEAIEEHWAPRAEHASLPRSPAGIILSLADKIDNLCAYFSVGLKPTSSSDPHALRRQTFGLLRILIEGAHSVNLKELLEACASRLPKPAPIEEILHFITSRAKSLFEDYHFEKDEIDASLRGLCVDPFDQYCKVKALHSFRKSPDFSKLFEVYKRAKGQLERPFQAVFQPALAHEAAEKTLARELDQIQTPLKQALCGKNYSEAFSQLARLQPPLAHLFDTVKILADDPALRANRIALLQKVFSLFDELIDFSKLSQGA